MRRSFFLWHRLFSLPTPLKLSQFVIQLLCAVKRLSILHYYTLFTSIETSLCCNCRVYKYLKPLCAIIVRTFTRAFSLPFAVCIKKSTYTASIWNHVIHTILLKYYLPIVVYTYQYYCYCDAFSAHVFVGMAHHLAPTSNPLPWSVDDNYHWRIPRDHQIRTPCIAW